MVSISQVSTPEDIADVRELLREYTAWALTLTADLELPPTFEGLESELAALPGIYAPPTGRLLLARHEGRAAGCVAMKGHDALTGELKRLYVRSSFRGLAIGRQLVAAVVEAARQSGYRRLVLDSHRSMTQAHALYREAGFRVVEAPSGFPEALAQVAVFMALDLE